MHLRIELENAILRLPTDGELEVLGARAVGRLLTQEQRLWLGEWAVLPSPDFQRNLLQYHWQQRGVLGPEAWNLQLGVFPLEEEYPVGIIGLSSRQFALKRSVSTGSWLIPEWRGMGLGTAMRRGVLALAFEHLGATEARSGAHPSNHASMSVSLRLGYQPDGVERSVLHGQLFEMRRLRLLRQDWKGAPEVKVSGLRGESLSLLGLGWAGHKPIQRTHPSQEE